MISNDKNVKIKVENLRKCFGDLEVLRDISTEIHEGEVVVILGPSGSGKSTFLRCMNKLEEVTAGKIHVDGVDITDKNVDMNKVRENIGMVFQHFNLFNNMDVLHNLMLAPVELKKCSKAEAKERAMEMLQRVDLAAENREAQMQVFNLENRVGHHCLPPDFGSSRSRMPSPNRLKPTAVIKIAAPGNAQYHHWSRT